jgi:thiol-disulfide isomerase/thioredoxin
MTSNVCVKYYGATWCGPCKNVKPRVEQMMKMYGIAAVYNDYDEMEEDEEKASVQKLPTLRIFVDAKQVSEIVTDHVSLLESWLRKNVRVNGEEDF